MPSDNAMQHRSTSGLRLGGSSLIQGSKGSLTSRQDGDQAVTELKDHHQKVLEFCARHEKLRDSKCYCFYHPDDQDKCHCFTHFLDDPGCHPASVNCASDPGNPSCMMNMAFDAGNPSGDDAAGASSATQSIETPTALPSATSSGINAADTTSTSSNPGAVATVGSSKGVNIPVIVGAAVGGVVFLALLYLAIILCLRRRRKRAERAPSAEFLGGSNSLLRRMHTAGSLPIQSPPTSVYGGVMVTADGMGEMLPAFSPGSFSDPVVEKVIGSVQVREAWHHRDAQQGSQDMRSHVGASVA